VLDLCGHLPRDLGLHGCLRLSLLLLLLLLLLLRLLSQDERSVLSTEAVQAGLLQILYPSLDSRLDLGIEARLALGKAACHLLIHGLLELPSAVCFLQPRRMPDRGGLLSNEPENILNHILNT